MENLGCQRRLWPTRMMSCMLGASALMCVGEPVAVAPRWQISFPGAANGKTVDSTAVSMDGGSLLVAVVSSGADAANPTVLMGGRTIPAQVVGHDPVSRLEFLKVSGSAFPKPVEWLDECGVNSGASLHALTPGGPEPCRTTGWVKLVGGKILPLALLRVDFNRVVPPPGTPLVDENGRVVALVFQGVGGNTGYAIPAEAIHRVRRDICNNGRLVRGWLGLTLRAESQSPQIVRVLPNSPAATAGIQPADVLQSVGSRQIIDYADAANAFFYLVPGQPVRVKLLRGKEPIEFTLTPTRPQAE